MLNVLLDADVNQQLVDILEKSQLMQGLLSEKDNGQFSSIVTLDVQRSAASIHASDNKFAICFGFEARSAMGMLRHENTEVVHNNRALIERFLPETSSLLSTYYARTQYLGVGVLNGHCQTAPFIANETMGVPVGVLSVAIDDKAITSITFVETVR